MYSQTARGKMAKRNGPSIVPDELESFEEAERFYQRDLPAMSDLRLLKEFDRTRHTFALHASRDEEDPTDRWLLERRVAIRAELEARGLYAE